MRPERRAALQLRHLTPPGADPEGHHTTTYSSDKSRESVVITWGHDAVGYTGEQAEHGGMGAWGYTGEQAECSGV